MIPKKAHHDPLEALKVMYRKHVLNDESLGWDEVGDMMCNCLCNTMTDRGYQDWLESVSGARANGKAVS